MPRKRFRRIPAIIFGFLLLFILFFVLYLKILTSTKKVYDTIFLGSSEFPPDFIHSSDSLFIYYEEPKKIVPLLNSNLYAHYRIPTRTLTSYPFISLPWNKFPKVISKVSLEYISVLENINVSFLKDNEYNLILINDISGLPGFLPETRYYARKIILIDDFFPFRYLSYNLNCFEQNFVCDGIITINDKKIKIKYHLISHEFFIILEEEIKDIEGELKITLSDLNPPTKPFFKLDESIRIKILAGK